MQDRDLSVPAIASQERLTIGYLSRLLRLPSLAEGEVPGIGDIASLREEIAALRADIRQRKS